MKNDPHCVKQEINLPFEERVDILFREIELAVRWDRPSIIFAIYKSDSIRDEVNSKLEGKLGKIGQKTHFIKTNEASQFDFLSNISQLPNLSETVLLIDGFNWECGADGLGVLKEFNKHREYFIDNNIRAIFWLFENEVSDFAENATECWILRHRVVEFVDVPQQEKSENQSFETLRKKVINTPSAEFFTDSPTEAKAPDIDANNDSSWAAIAKAYMESGQLGNAENSLRKAVELNVHLTEAWVNLGRCFAQQKHDTDAIAIYNKAIEFNPESAEIWDELGRLYLEKQNYVDSITAFQKVISLDPQNGEAHLKLGLALFQIGDYETSASIYEKALPLFTDNVARSIIWNHLGDTYLRLKDYEKAIAAYKISGPLQGETEATAEKKDELVEEIQDVPTTGNQGLEEKNPGKVTGEEMNEANHLLDMKTAAEWNEHGNAHLKAGAYNDAIAAYTKAIELAPNACWPYIQNLAHVHYQIGKAKGKLTIGKTEDPDVWEGEEDSLTSSLFGMETITKLVQGDENEEPSLENTNKKYSAGKIQAEANDGPVPPNNAESFGSRSRSKLKMVLEPTEEESTVLRENGNISIEDLQRINPEATFSVNSPIKVQFVENTPRDAIDWNELGNSFASSKKLDNAIEAYKKAIEMNPKFGHPYCNLGFVYYRLGKYDEAVSLYKKSIELLDNLEDKAISWNRLGDAYRRLGDYGNALSAYQKSNELAPALSPVMARARTTLLENIVAG